MAALQAASTRLDDEAVEDGTGIVRVASETRRLTESDLQRLDELLGALRQLMTPQMPTSLARAVTQPWSRLHRNR